MNSIIKILFRVLLIAAALAFSVVSNANDGFGELGVGGIYLSRTNDIAMRSEVLDIGYSAIQVVYEFENESDHDVTSVISFPLPLYPAFPRQSGVIAKGQPSDFSVAVNDSPIQYTTKVQAISHGQDVTAQLHALGLTDRAVARMPFSIEGSLAQSDPYDGILTSSQIKSLTKLGLIVDGDPIWMIQVTYRWIQKFPAKSRLNVTHKYKPFVATGTASGYDSENFMSRFCIDPLTKRKLDGLVSNEDGLGTYRQLGGSIVAYVLKTANTWKNGIGDFTLRLHKGSPAEMISLCFPGKFEKIDPLTVESHVQHFNPSADLDIYFSNIRQGKSTEEYGEAPTVD